MFGFEKINRDKITNSLVQHVGLHPLVALGMIGIDMMLFASDTLGPVGWMISCIVGTLLLIPAVILQRYAYRDSWLVAIAKGIIVGILTAIPTPLPAFLTGASGMLGAIGTFQGITGDNSKVIQSEKESATKIIDAEVIDVESHEVIDPAPDKNQKINNRRSE